jgi:hypothetical protein
MARAKGTAKTGGRQKGSPNKLTADLKEMILGALNAQGGQRYLEQQAKENPVAFLTLVGKVLPMTVQGNPEQPVVLNVTTGVPRSRPEESDERQQARAAAANGVSPIH